ncbi:MAG: tol-pal system protein YbgF [Betaproteobacteria bacterium]|nr:tol-pal system protein YbgF [Betaproteobacteria bacterium]
MNTNRSPVLWTLLLLSAGAHGQTPVPVTAPVPVAAPAVVAPRPATPVIAAPILEAAPPAARTPDWKTAMQSQEDRIARLEAQLQNQGLLNLLNQVEALKAEVARLRGAQEEQTHHAAEADTRAKELYADLDGRIKELASRPSGPPPEAVRLQPAQGLVNGAPPGADASGEAKAYEAAQNLVKGGRYKEAVPAFQAFLKQYPSGALTANAWYWLGFSHVAQSDFKGGATIFQRMVKDFPAHAKAPDAMLSLARAQIQLNEPEAAKTMLEQLLVKHPASRAAENGKRLLSTLK